MGQCASISKHFLRQNAIFANSRFGYICMVGIRAKNPSAMLYHWLNNMQTVAQVSASLYHSFFIFRFIAMSFDGQKLLENNNNIGSKHE
jgi:hypothetical protein